MTFVEAMLLHYDPLNLHRADPELSDALHADVMAQVGEVIAADDRAQDRAWIATGAALDKAARDSRSD